MAVDGRQVWLLHRGRAAMHFRSRLDDDRAPQPCSFTADAHFGTHSRTYGPPRVCYTRLCDAAHGQQGPYIATVVLCSSDWGAFLHSAQPLIHSLSQRRNVTAGPEPALLG